MMRHVTLLFAGYVAAVMESSEFTGIGGGVPICWLLMAATAAAWSMSATEAALWGSLLGLLWDTVSPGTIGPGVLIVGTLTGVLAIVVQRFRPRSVVSFGVIMVVLVAANICLWELSQALILQTPFVAEDLTTRACTAAAATGVVGCVVLLICRKTAVSRIVWSSSPRGV